MQRNELKRKTKRATSTQVGRGGKRGKTSGRGHKGQGQHGSHGVRPEWRDTIKRLPKLRGRGVNSNKSIQLDSMAINISKLDSLFENGGEVTPAILFDKKAVRQINGRPAPVKILGTGETNKKFTITGCAFSETAKAKIEKAGGSVQ